MDAEATRFFRFDGFVVDTLRRELRDAAGSVLPLTSKAFDTLGVLIAQRDRVVPKDDLMATVWAGRVVEENNLTQAVSALRRAFGTGINDHRYIITVPGRGYRFVAELSEEPILQVAPPDIATPMAVTTSALAGPARRAWLLGGLLGALALLAGAGLRERQASQSPAVAAPLPATSAVVVLPFRSLSAGARDELLELGMAETLVTRLGRSASLRVRSLTSVQRLAATQADALVVGRELGAVYVLEGSTQRIGDQVRVNARLLSVGKGTTLWSDTFDARVDRVFTVQDRIADAVTTALAVQPVAVPTRALSPCDGDDADAYRALLRAQYQLHRRDPGTIAGFQDAIRRDPVCVRAYAGLASAYLFMAHNDRPPLDVFPLAGAAANQALRIDPESAEAQMAHGRYLQLYAWNWQGSEAALRRAIERNPSLAEARFGLAHLLVTTGRFEEGLAQARQARELDPLSPLLNALEAGFLTAAGQPQAAQQRIARALELDPEFWIALLVRGGMALDRGDAAAAVADFTRATANSRRASQVLAMLAVAEVAAGRRTRAQAILGELEARAGDGHYVPATSLAAVHNALGNRAAALDQLERAHREHDIRIGFIGVDARWNDLRDAPRFQALAARLALPHGPARGRY